MPTILFRNATIITMDRTRSVAKGSDVRVENSTIQAIGPNLEPKADRIIDASGKTLIPGFVQTHIHLSQALFRGASDDLELLDWLRKRTWPLEAAHDEESIYYSALLGIAELFKGGTTSVIDMQTVNHTEAAFRAILTSGIRAMSGKVMMDHGDQVPKGLFDTSYKALEESIDLAAKWHGQGNGRFSYAFAPRFAVSCTDFLLRQVGKVAQAMDLHIHTHCAENKEEVAIVLRERGMSNAMYLGDAGLLGPKTILAHCIWLTDEEIDLLARTGTHVAHCPTCNLKLASGIARVPEMLDRGINVTLGADGAGANNNLDQFLEMRHAALIQKPRLGPTAMPAMTVLEMATIRGAKAMGMESQIGSLEAGKKADIVMLDLRTPHAWPEHGVDPASRLVYSAKSSDVVLTMVDGRIVYENGRLLTMDEEEVLDRSEACLRRMHDRAGIGIY